MLVLAAILVLLVSVLAAHMAALWRHTLVVVQAVLAAALVRIAIMAHLVGRATIVSSLVM